MSESPVGLTRFVILAAPRTGSNWLCSLLNSHPDILCHHEVFNPSGIFYAADRRDGSINLGTVEERDDRPLEFLDRLWWNSLGFPCVGFKMTRGQNEPVLEAVLEDRGVRKILLRRGNALRTYISELIAMETGRWEVYDRREPSAGPLWVRVDVDGLRSHIETNAAFYNRLEEELRRTAQEFVSTAYESLSCAEEHSRLLQYLGVSRNEIIALEGRSIRQNPQRLSQLVANYHELKSALEGSDLGPLLDMDEDEQCRTRL